MQQLSVYYAKALKDLMDKQARGIRRRLAEATGVSPGLITDIVYGRKYGSEESRRALASALGWPYEEFLRYGECLVTGQEYKRPEPVLSPFDPDLYETIPFYSGLMELPAPEGQIHVPDPQTNKGSVPILKRFLENYGHSKYLASFATPDSGMEPTIKRNSLIIVDANDRSLQDNKCYLVSCPSGFTIRRLRCGAENNDIFLLSDNPSVHPQKITQAWESIAVGKVIFNLTDLG